MLLFTESSSFKNYELQALKQMVHPVNIQKQQLEIFFPQTSSGDFQYKYAFQISH